MKSSLSCLQEWKMWRAKGKVAALTHDRVSFGQSIAPQSDEMHQGDLFIMEADGTSTTAFIIDSPFDPALTRIRRAIRADQLAIAAEIDTARRVKRALDIHVPPCRVLLIDNPAFVLEATAVDRASGIFIPLHLVVTGTGNRTLVYMLNVEHIRQSNLPIGIKAPVLHLQRQVSRSLLTVAERARSPENRALTEATGPKKRA